MQVVWVRWHSLDRLSAVVAGHWLSLDGVVVGWWGQPLNFYSSLSLSLICPGCERYFLWFNAGKYMWSLGWLLLYNSLIRMGKLGRNSIPPVFFFFFFFSAAIVNCPFASRPRRDSRRWQEPHTKLGGAFDGFRFESQLVALERPLLFFVSLWVSCIHHVIRPGRGIAFAPRHAPAIKFHLILFSSLSLSLLPFSARRRQLEKINP